MSWEWGRNPWVRGDGNGDTGNAVCVGEERGAESLWGEE